MQEFAIDTARPEDLPALSNLLAELFSLETDFAVDRDRQIRGLRMILDAPERGTLLVARARTGTVCPGKQLFWNWEGMRVFL